MIIAGKHDVFVSGAQFEGQLASGTMSILEVAPIAAKLGAKGVEYRDVYWKDKANELPAVRDQLQQLDLKVAYATFATLYSRDQARREQLVQDLEDARALGAPLIRVFRGERVASSAEDVAMLDAARAFVDRAGSYGMRVALENYSGVAGGKLAEIREVLEQINSPVMGTNLDFANYDRNGEDPLAAIKELAPVILFSHLKDVHIAPDGRKNVYLGGGSLPLREILSALVATGRSFPFCFEFKSEGDPEGEITKSMEYLAKLESRLGKRQEAGEPDGETRGHGDAEKHNRMDRMDSMNRTGRMGE